MVAPDPNAYIPTPAPMPPKKPRYHVPEPWQGVFKQLEGIAKVDATVAFHLAAFNLPDSNLSLPQLMGYLIVALANEKQIYMAHNAALLAQLPPTGEHHE